jgi:PmbA protein
MERDYESEIRTHRGDLAAPATVGRTAGERAVKRLHPRQMDTGRTTVVFHPRVARGLVGHLAGAISGSAIARRTSFLREKLVTAVFPAGITITDDPLRPRGLASRPFDGEGVAPQTLDVVRDGVLQVWLLDSASAREIGMTTNGHAGRGGGNPAPTATNLTLAPGERSPEALIADVGDGLYVTEMIGHGANMVTGDYSRGATGFVIRKGALAEPVSEITIAGNLVDMFAHLEAASDLEYRTSVNAPTLAVAGMTIAGR